MLQIMSLGPDTTMPMIYFFLYINPCCHVMTSICMHSFVFYLRVCRAGCQLRESWLALTSRTFLPVKGEPRSYSHGDSYYSVQWSFTDNFHFCGSSSFGIVLKVTIKVPRVPTNHSRVVLVFVVVVSQDLQEI